MPSKNTELEDYLAGTAIISGESVGTFYSYEFLGLKRTKRNTGIR